jgi:DNA-binding beta-propeller fold protein YncE
MLSIYEQFLHPRSIAIDADDNIVVTDSDNYRIQIFSKDGNWMKTIGKSGYGDGVFNYAWNAAVCKSDGRIFVSDCHNHRIQVFSSDGGFLFKFGSERPENGQFEYPRGLALSNCGQFLFICDQDNHCI